MHDWRTILARDLSYGAGKLTPIPEPTSDIDAQITALLDPEHPKNSVFIVPGNEVPNVPLGVSKIARPEGTLLTRDPACAEAFHAAADDATMARILGYPEEKYEAVAACGGNLSAGHMVQARDISGNVITEALASPPGLERVRLAIMTHVPRGGSLVVLSAAQSIMRRLKLRAMEDADG